MNEENIPHNSFHHNHRKASYNDNNQFRAIRQWLNIIFMIGAIVGVIFYLSLDNQTVGIIIILVSMVFKFIEAALRLIRHK